jgi:hypothetical protein
VRRVRFDPDSDRFLVSGGNLVSADLAVRALRAAFAMPLRRALQCLLAGRGEPRG